MTTSQPRGWQTGRLVSVILFDFQVVKSSFRSFDEGVEEDNAYAADMTTSQPRGWQTGRLVSVILFDSLVEGTEAGLHDLSHAAFGDFLTELGDRFVDLQLLAFVVAEQTVAHVDGVFGSFLFADDEHVRDQLKLSVAHLRVDAAAGV